MATSTKPASVTQQMQKQLQLYFTALAPKYSSLTGNTTRDLLLAFLNDTSNGLLLNQNSKVHDNASGPGTATEAITSWLQSQNVNNYPHITATDFVPAMISALNSIKSTNETWKTVTAEVQDSHALTFSDNAFTHVFCNFSIFTFADPLLALQEIYRTLEYGGQSIITTWRRFAVYDIMHAAQRVVQGNDVEAMKMPGQEFMALGYLAEMVLKAGWQQDKIRTVEQSMLITDESDLRGLIGFMTGPFSAMTRSSFSEQENLKWPQAIMDAVVSEQKEHGGLLLKAWVVIATK